MYILLFLLSFNSVTCRESALVKSLHLQHGYLLNKKIEATRKIPAYIKNVLNRPLLKANADFAHYGSEEYVSLVKADGILNVITRYMGGRTFCLPFNRAFFHIDNKSFLFHPHANYPNHLFICPDIPGIIAPNFIINTLSENEAKSLIKKDYQSFLEIASSNGDEFVDAVLDGYERSVKLNQQLCLTLVIMHRSMAQKLLYSMLDQDGNPIIEDAVSHAFACKQAYIKDPLRYQNAHYCKITLRGTQENFKHNLLVRHYFCDETREWIDELLQF